LVGNSVDTICKGDVKTVVVRKIGSGNIFFFPSGVPFQQLNDSTFEVEPASTYTFDFFPTGSTGCVGAPLQYKVVVKPKFPVTITSSVGAGPLCLGSPMTLNATLIPGCNYTWSPDPSLTSTSGNVVVATPTVTTTYTCNVSGNGCTFQYFYTKTVISTVPTLTLNTGNVFICSGSSFNILASPSAGSGVTWSPSIGLDTIFGNSVIAQPSATTTYTATAINISGCTTTQTCTVNVSSLPTFNSSVGNDDTICVGGALNIQLSNSSLNYSILPYLSSTVYNNVTKTFNVQPTTNTVFTITGTNGTCNKSTPVSITVLGNININTPVESHRLCPGQALYQHVNQITTNNSTQYTWQPSSTVSMINPNGGEVYLAPNVTTTYTVTGSNGGCTDTAQIHIEMVGNPTFTVPFATATIVQGNSHNFVSISNGTTFHWKPSIGVSDTTIRNPVLNPTTTTVYTIHAYGQYGMCAARKNFTLNVTPIKQASIVDAVTELYPNPSTDFVTVVIDARADEELQLFDTQARLVRVIKTNGENSVEIAVDDLLDGVYYLKMMHDTSNKSIKIVKISK
jgi:hypothetical protein